MGVKAILLKEDVALKGHRNPEKTLPIKGKAKTSPDRRKETHLAARPQAGKQMPLFATIGPKENALVANSALSFISQYAPPTKPAHAKMDLLANISTSRAKQQAQHHVLQVTIFFQRSEEEE